MTPERATDQRLSARSQLIELLAARLVREALADRALSGDGHGDESSAVRQVQHGQAARDLDR